MPDLVPTQYSMVMIKNTSVISRQKLADLTING